MPHNGSATGKLTRRWAFKPRIDPLSSLWKDTDNFQDFIDFLVEAVRNECDAWNREHCGDLRITIQFVRRGHGRIDLLVYGNGEGISDAGLEAIVCMNLSPSAEDESKRGKTGTGAKAGCWHCKSVRVMTIRRGESIMLQIGYSWTELIEMWRSGELVNWDECEIPPGSVIQGHGTCFVFEDLGKGENVDSKHDRSVERVVNELAQKLSPELAEAIMVVDTRGKQHKLSPRSIHGDKIQGVSSIPEIGQIAYVISVTERRAVRDELSVWAHDRVSSITQFLRRVRPTAAIAPLLDAVNVTLDHPHVIGYLAIPTWNRFVTSNRSTWKQQLFDDEQQLFALLKWLYTEIVPQIEAKIGQDRTKTVSDNETFRNMLVEEFQRAGGAPKTDRDVADITMEPTIETDAVRIMLEPGMEMDISIVSPKPGTTYVWDDTQALGDVSPRRGTRVTFTAGSVLGHGEIFVSAGQHRRRISTHIVRELPFGFVVASRHGLPGQTITHTLEHTHHMMGEPTWTVTRGGGKLTLGKDKLSAEHMLPDEEGTYEVTVSATLTGNRRVEVTCTIFVAHRSEGTRPRKTSKTEWIWEGHRYELMIRSYHRKEQARYASWLDAAVDDNASRITLNFGHPIFTGNDRVRRSAAIMQIALCIAQDQLRRDPVITAGMPHGEWVPARAAEICAKFMENES